MNKPSASKPGSPPPSAISKALRLLTLLAQAPDALALREVAEQAGVAKSSAHRLLAELIAEGYVEPAGRGTYRPGPGLRVLAAAMEGHSGFGITAVLDALADQVQHTVCLVVRSDNHVTITHKAQPDLPYAMTADVGTQLPLHTSAAGLAILAHLPAGEPTDDAELQQVRRHGWALEYGTNDPLTCSVAAPVLDHDGVPVAAIAVLTLTIATTQTQLRRLGPAVVAAARDVAKRL